MKKFLLVIFIILSIIVILFVVNVDRLNSVLSTTKYTNNISNKDSDLVPLLIDENVFSNKWKWDLIYTKQSNNTPSASNNYLIQTATRYFVGSYQNNQVDVRQYIYEYDENTNINLLRKKIYEEWKENYKDAEIIIRINKEYAEFPAKIICRHENEKYDFSCILIFESESYINNVFIIGDDINFEGDREDILNSMILVLQEQYY